MKTKRYKDVEELKDEHVRQREAIRRRLTEFSRVPRSEYFYELVYCLLTPQSSAVNAEKAVDALKKADLWQNEIEPSALLRQKSFYIRFHNTKAKHLLLAKKLFPEILSELSNGSSSPELRHWLVKNVKGLGWKEASHLLRNIGHRNLAILDRHILKNLKRHGAIRSLPRTLTAKRYLSIETRFARMADDLSIPMDELDLLFWSRETGEILK